MNNHKHLSVIVVLLALVLSACSGSPAKAYPLNDEVTCVTISDGAKIRESPYVPGQDDSPNEVLTIDMKDNKSFKSSPSSFTVKTPEGVAEVNEFHNRLWYGIRRSDLSAALMGELAAKIGGDDTLVWVNESKAQRGCT